VSKLRNAGTIETSHLTFYIRSQGRGILNRLVRQEGDHRLCGAEERGFGSKEESEVETGIEDFVKDLRDLMGRAKDPVGREVLCIG